MKQATIDRLNNLNQQFYRQVATEFSQTRQEPWKGWGRLGEWLPTGEIKRVCDVGCGNGRFLGYIQKEWGFDGEYFGVDTNDELLAEAREKYPQFSWETGDVVGGEIEKSGAGFDLVVAFGLIHHVAGKGNRVDKVREWLGLVKQGGLVVVTVWKFAEFERFMAKVVEWKRLGINGDEIEEGDFLLGWGESDSLRYCHYLSDNETQDLVDKSGAKLVGEFRADGKNGKLNQYLVLQRKD